MVVGTDDVQPVNFCAVREVISVQLACYKVTNANCWVICIRLLLIEQHACLQRSGPYFRSQRLPTYVSPFLAGVFKVLKCLADCQVLKDAVEEKARHREVEQRLVGASEGLGL